MADKYLSESENRTVVLIAFIINEMALADGFSSLAAASKVHPKIVDIYARYGAAALRAMEHYQVNPVRVAVCEDEDASHA